MKVERAKQWLEFTLDDLKMAEILKREGKLKGAMYHIQQSVEKSIKSVIVLYDSTFAISRYNFNNRLI